MLSTHYLQIIRYDSGISYGVTKAASASQYTSVTTGK